MTGRHRIARLALIAAALVVVIVLATAAEPVLSERVRGLITEKGIEGARIELPMLIASSMGKLESDEEGMLALADEYIKDGNFDAAELVVTVQMIAGNSPAVAAKQGDVYMAKGVPLSVDPDNEHAKRGLSLITEEHPEVSSFVNPQTKPEPTAKPADTGGKPAQTTVNLDPPPRTQGGGDTLLPYVVVTDPDKVQSLDYQCKYRVHLPNGDSTVVLSVYVELHGEEQARKNELSFSEGVSGSQFTPFDPGAPDLKVYVNQKSEYLYVFPRDGRTMWRLGYRGDSVDPERFQRESGLDPDLGPRFLELLVEKYGGRL